MRLYNSVSSSILKAVLDGLVEKAKKEEQEHPRSINKFWPSGIGRCLRAQYYSYMIPTYDHRKLAIFATGSAIHAILPEIIRLGGLNVKATEVKIEQRHPTKDLYLTGRIDVLLVEKDGETVVLEIKSTKSIPQRPHESHILQLQCYLNCLGLNRGAILYWGKANGDIKLFELRRDGGMMFKVWRRVEEVHRSLQNNQPPLKEGTENGWECLFCEYFLPCFFPSVKAPLVAEWKFHRGPYSALINTLRTEARSGREVVIVADYPLRESPSFAKVVVKPRAYDDRWYDRAREELQKIGAMFVTNKPR